MTIIYKFNPLALQLPKLLLTYEHGLNGRHVVSATNL